MTNPANEPTYFAHGQYPEVKGYILDSILEAAEETDCDAYQDLHEILCRDGGASWESWQPGVLVDVALGRLSQGTLNLAIDKIDRHLLRLANQQVMEEILVERFQGEETGGDEVLFAPLAMTPSPGIGGGGVLYQAPFLIQREYSAQNDNQPYYGKLIESRPAAFGSNLGTAATAQVLWGVEQHDSETEVVEVLESEHLKLNHEAEENG